MSLLKIVMTQEQQRRDNDARRREEEARALERLHALYMETVWMMVASNYKNEHDDDKV